MTPKEIDRIFAHRASGNWINSHEEFWTISEVPEDRRNNILMRLRFKKKDAERVPVDHESKSNPKPVIKDINKISAYELMEVRGIGPVLSERIVKFRNRLGGFQVMEQLFDVYGLDGEVVKRLFERFDIIEKPSLELININEASAEDIAKLIYLSKAVAYRIVLYREQHGPLENLEELTKIEGFPSDKIDRISLYLSL